MSLPSAPGPLVSVTLLGTLADPPRLFGEVLGFTVAGTETRAGFPELSRSAFYIRARARGELAELLREAVPGQFLALQGTLWSETQRPGSVYVRALALNLSGPPLPGDLREDRSKALRSLWGVNTLQFCGPLNSEVTLSRPMPGGPLLASALLGTAESGGPFLLSASGHAAYAFTGLRRGDVISGSGRLLRRDAPEGVIEVLGADAAERFD